MYARQVEKDGIRRTLMTNSGCATERHFTKDDFLKKLFKLSPKGECKMLEKIKSSVENGAQGSSGKRSILEKHDGVIGISSHDLVYTNKIVDLVQPEQPPFAGTPLKQSSFQFTSRLPVRHITFEQIARDAIPLRSSTKDNEGEKAETFNNDLNVEGEMVIAPFSKLSCESVEKDTVTKVDQELKQIEELTGDGKVGESLDALLRLLESTDLKGGTKLLVHQKIVARARMYYGWK